MMSHRRILLLVAFIVAGGLVSTLIREDDLATVEGLPVVRSDAIAHGVTLAEWSARHWEWTLEIPIASNPGQDVTGATCGTGQVAPVFFVPRNFPPCQVPAGWSVLIPVVGSECSTVEATPYHGQTPDELRACAEQDVDRYVNIVVRIDGELVPEIDAYRVSSPPVVITLPEHNVLGAPAGEATVVGDGYQMMLAPLPQGEHEIMVHVELDDGTVLPDKVLHLTVGP
jgi:hypothetical protein